LRVGHHDVGMFALSALHQAFGSEHPEPS
jgi:hypothetical protein